MKKCSKCSAEKEPGVRGSLCRACVATRARVWREANRERAREIARRGHARWRQKQAWKRKLDDLTEVILSCAETDPVAREIAELWLAKLPAFLSTPPAK